MVLLAGVVSDKLGLRRAALFYTALIGIGAVLFCTGLQPTIKSFYALMAGRFLFGVGAESAYGTFPSIAQYEIL
jgi:MFS family permease